MKALVISGGGAKGAWAGGFIEYLAREQGMKWDILIGSSTGSLLVPMIAVDGWDELKKAYTTSGQYDIFSTCPFRVHKSDHGFKASFNHWRILLQFIQGRKTLGESRNLKKLIENTFTPERWEQLQSSGRQVIVTVSNLTHNVIEYKYARDYDYEEFCDWIWSSCNLVPFMSLFSKNGNDYADAGFGNPIPVQEAINLGASEIDVVILQPRHHVHTLPAPTNSFLLLMRTFTFMQHQLALDDVTMALAETRYTGCKVRLFHTPIQLTDNSFIFDPDQMSSWWKLGYAHGRFTFEEGRWA